MVWGLGRKVVSLITVDSTLGGGLKLSGLSVKSISGFA